MLYFSTEEITINETKVVIRPEYRTMSKNFWLYSETWRDQDEVKGKNLVIGGEYSVWKIDKGRVIYLEDKYTRYDRPYTIGIHDLIPMEDAEPCRFSIGDEVIPSNEFDTQEVRKELPSYYDRSLSQKRANIVTGFLNKYFIFIDEPPHSAYSLPFYCGDFVLSRPNDD